MNDQAGGRSDIHRTERASATPALKTLPRLRRGGATTPRLRSLKSQLAWFQDAVTAPKAPRDGGILQRPELLEVYRYAYRARLEEALDDDFEAVRVMAGPRWPRLMAGYLRDCPPVSKTLNDYGARFPDWLRQRRHVLLADLAKMEWALIEVLHAPAATLLDHATLARIPLEQWGAARFTAAPTLRLVESPWPINQVLDRIRDGEIPEKPKRQTSLTAVYRRGFDLWRQSLNPEAGNVLVALVAGQTLEQALEGVPDSAAEAVMGWFTDWVAKGFFAGVQLR